MPSDFYNHKALFVKYQSFYSFFFFVKHGNVYNMSLLLMK